MIFRFARVAGATLLLAAGCSTTNSSGPPVDSGPPKDASAADASASDTGAPVSDTAPSTDGAPADAVVQIPAPVKAVDHARYQKDLLVIAKPRPPGSAHWQTVQDLCADRFKTLGYDVQLHKYGSGVNVIGTLKGTTQPDEQVIVSAHYDSTHASCDGADDNASGTAGLLETARVLASGPHARTLIVACWDEEERGLVGSEHYAKEAKARGDKIVMMYGYEMIGYYTDTPNSQTLPPGLGLLFPNEVAQVEKNDYRGDFIAIVFAANPDAKTAATSFASTGAAVGLSVVPLAVPNGIKNSALVADLRRSDHAEFWRNDYPGMMVTDSADFRNTHYHCSGGPDTADRLDQQFTGRVIQATVGSALTLLDP